MINFAKRFRISPFAAIAAAFVLSGCVSQALNPAPPGPVMTAAPLPDYKKGDRFTFDDGRTYRVTRVGGDVVTWTLGKNFTFTTPRNPILPRRDWESRTKRSRAGGMHGSPAALWPLQVGKSARFSYSNTVTDKRSRTSKSYSQSWNCSVARTQRLTVPAGTFNTFVIPCHRQSVGVGAYYGTRTLYYAPNIGHVIRQVDAFSRRAGVTASLVAAKRALPDLPKADRRTLGISVQKTLETGKRDQTTSWVSADRSVRVKLTPQRTFRSRSKAASTKARPLICRTYLQTYIHRNRADTVAKTACRKKGGSWKIL